MKNKFGLGNRVTPYKKRKIKMNKPILVYRCLRGKKVKYSIQQDQKVVAHTDCIMLNECEFIVRKTGRDKVLKTKQKNVHAFIKGYISKQGGMGVTAEDGETSQHHTLPAKIEYNPYKSDSFLITNLTMKPSPIKGALVVTLNKKGVYGSYTF